MCACVVKQILCELVCAAGAQQLLGGNCEYCVSNFSSCNRQAAFCFCARIHLSICKVTTNFLKLPQNLLTNVRNAVNLVSA